MARVVRTGDDSLLALLADGAGGTSGGRESATWALDELERRLKSVRIGREPLHHVMSELAVEAQERSAGQTTLIVVQFTGTRLVGASIGDSEVRLFDPTSCQTLTDGQQRKPLLGGGIPRIHSFEAELQFNALLVIASDGLWRFAHEPLPAVDTVRGSLPSIATALIDAARLPNGQLQDDVSLIAIRVARAQEAPAAMV